MDSRLGKQQSHLTDEQFADLLLGLPSPSVRAHLELCPHCSDEAQRVSGAISSFAQQSRLWAERHAASLPAHKPGWQPVLPRLHRPQAWAAVALTIALASGLGVSLRIDHTRSSQQLAVQPVAVVPSTTLTEDNQLLSAIDGELRADDSTNANMYGLNVTSRGAARTRESKRMSNE